jgi:cell division transport system permease protein
MNIYSIEFALREALANVRRHGVMAAATVSTVAISFVVLGVFLVALFATDNLTGTWNRKLEIAAFVSDSVSTEQARVIGRRISRIPHVAECEFVASEAAWPAFKEEMGFGPDDPLGGIENPLPDAFRIRVDDAHQIAAVAGAIGRLDGIEDVREWAMVARRLVTVSDFVKIGGITVAVCLFLGMAAVIANALHLTIFARRREISIMRLVGATDGFVRLPLVLEGVLFGVLGAAVAAGVILLVYSWGIVALSRAAPFLEPFYAGLPGSQFAGLLCGLGLIVGLGGSLVSIRRYLPAQ